MTLSDYQRKAVERIQRMQREGLPVEEELKKLPPRLSDNIRRTQIHADVVPNPRPFSKESGRIR